MGLGELGLGEMAGHHAKYFKYFKYLLAKVF